MNIKSIWRNNKNNISIAISVILFVYFIYDTFIYDKKASIDFIIENNTEVFDVKEPIANLEVIYDGNKLLKFGKELKLLSIRVENTGNVNINEKDYYSKSDFGFKISPADILQHPKVTDNNIQDVEIKLSYIDSQDVILLPKIPMDVDDFYTIKVLYLAESSNISILPQGKISGVRNIPVINEVKKEKNDIQSLSWAEYFVFGIFAIIFLGNIIFYTVEWYRKRHKRNLLKKFENKFNDVTIPNVIKSLYFRYGRNTFKEYEPMLTDDSIFQAIYKSDQVVMSELQKQKEHDPKLDNYYQNNYCRHKTQYPIREIIDTRSEVMFQKNSRGIVDPSLGLKDKFREDMSNFFTFLNYN